MVGNFDLFTFLGLIAPKMKVLFAALITVSVFAADDCDDPVTLDYCTGYGKLDCGNGYIEQIIYEKEGCVSPFFTMCFKLGGTFTGVSGKKLRIPYNCDDAKDALVDDGDIAAVEKGKCYDGFEVDGKDVPTKWSCEESAAAGITAASALVVALLAMFN